MEEVLIPAAAPGAGPGLPLLDYDRHAPDWIDWDVWATRYPHDPLLARPRVVCRTYAQSVGRSMAGEGIALASRTLLEAELSSGALMPLGAAHRTGKGYHLIGREGAELRSDVVGLRAALDGGSNEQAAAGEV